MLSQRTQQPTLTTNRNGPRRFCQYPVAIMTPEGLTLTTCGIGYQHKSRKHKELPYCTHHIKIVLRGMRK